MIINVLSADHFAYVGRLAYKTRLVNGKDWFDEEQMSQCNILTI
jgi:hypothetical protein